VQGKDLQAASSNVTRPTFGVIGMPCSTPSRDRRIRLATVSLVMPVLSRTARPFLVVLNPPSRPFADVYFVAGGIAALRFLPLAVDAEEQLTSVEASHLSLFEAIVVTKTFEKDSGLVTRLQAARAPCRLV
jgi:hypothetical protein